MRFLFRHLLTIVCALYLSGAHWMVLQMTAWTGMLVTRSADAGVTAAVETTFDGDHPCPMCVAILKAQEQEEKQQQEQKLPDIKKMMEIKLVALRTCELPRICEAGQTAWAWLSQDAKARTEAPPTPPPVA